MTDGMINLLALVEKAADSDVLHAMISLAAERLIELEVGTLTRAALCEKGANRLV